MNKVTLDLRNLDGNAFTLLGAFAAAARSQGWGEDDIGAVLGEATAVDYTHLLRTLQAHCEGWGEVAAADV